MRVPASAIACYYQEASVVGQAQQVWNQSRILQQFKAGEIIRGRFGYQEVETGYIMVLGTCGQTDHVWKNTKTGMTTWNGKPYENLLAMP